MVRKKINRYRVIALFIAAANLRPAITSVSPLLKTIQEDLHMTNMWASLLTALPVLCMGIFALFVSKIKLRMEQAISFCLFLIGSMTFLRLIATTSSILLFTSFAIGAGIAIAGPLLSGFIKQEFPNHTPLMIGVLSLGIGIGASVSAGLSIPLQHAFHGSWQASLAFWGILSVLALIIWIPLMKRKQTINDQQLVQKVQLPWKSKRAWIITIFFGLQSVLYFSITAWLAPMSEEIGFSKMSAGTLMTVFSLIQMISSLVIPTLMERVGTRQNWLLGCTYISLAGLLVLFVSQPITYWVASILIGIGFGGLFPIGLLLPLDETNSAEEASTWSSMTQSFGYLIGGFGPIVFGLLRDQFGQNRVIVIGLTIVAFFMLSSVIKIGHKASD